MRAVSRACALSCVCLCVCVCVCGRACASQGSLFPSLLQLMAKSGQAEGGTIAFLNHRWSWLGLVAAGFCLLGFVADVTVQVSNTRRFMVAASL